MNTPAIVIESVWRCILLKKNDDSICLSNQVFELLGRYITQTEFSSVILVVAITSETPTTKIQLFFAVQSEISRELPP